MHLDAEQLEQARTMAQLIERELHHGNPRRPAVRYQDRHLTAISLSDAPPQDHGSQFMAMAHFMLLVGKLSRWRFAKPTLAAEKIVHIGRAISHLERHYDEPLHLATLAKLTGMSHRTFYRMFHIVTGQTPSSYLQQLRITKAAQILRTTDKTVTEVAFQCGFEDSSYFARCFRQRFGVSPRESKRRPQA
jgi:AraC family L-rhamnose operon transcriptional activator RhaR/AraC family L-rhamnose operon regulatory protein RhaS